MTEPKLNFRGQKMWGNPKKLFLPQQVKKNVNFGPLKMEKMTFFKKPEFCDLTEHCTMGICAASFEKFKVEARSEVSASKLRQNWGI